MTTAIYIFWGLIPVFFCGMWLISLLEKKVGKKKTETPGDFLNSFLFTTACFGVFALLDYVAVDTIANDLLVSYVPRNAVLFLTYPVLLWIGAKVTGGSKPIRITKAPGKRSV